MLKGMAFGQRTCFDQGAPNLRVSRRNAVFSRFNKPPLTKIPAAVLSRTSLIEAVHVEDMGGQLAVVLPMLPSTHGVASARGQKCVDMSIEVDPLGEPGEHNAQWSPA